MSSSLVICLLIGCLAALSVVALHGLNGHAFDTWKYRSSSDSNDSFMCLRDYRSSSDGNDCFMWLRDSLPKHFPGARVLTYGYNANVLSDVSTGRLRTFADTFLEKLRLEREDKVVSESLPSSVHWNTRLS